MLPKIRTQVAETFFPHRSMDRQQGVDFTRMGMLYILAGAFQLGWVVILVVNWQFTTKYAQLPVLGWAMVVIWAGMAWCTLHLPYVGSRLIMLSRKRTMTLVQTRGDLKRQKAVVTLLVIGIVADVLFLPIGFVAADKSAVVLFSAIMGGRILQANSEAIFAYHGV